MNLIDVARAFDTEDKCWDYLEKMRWPSGVACVKCGSTHVSKFTGKGKTGKARRLYECMEKECSHQFSPTSGTIFHDSHLPLSKWFLAISLYCDGKKSVSALQLQRHLGLGSYRTAWHLGHRIRKAIEQSSDFFSGVVEIDETFIGGRYDKRRKRGQHDKQAVMGFVQRGKGGKPSKVRAFPVAGTGKGQLNPPVHANVSPDATMICTDENKSYHSLGREGFTHHTANHKRLEWIRPSQLGLVHTNSIENFWSLFKRGLVGSFHQVSRKHLDRYLDEFAFRFNRRDTDVFTATVERLVHGERLSYRALVNGDASPKASS
jgi:transposase-like protein